MTRPNQGKQYDYLFKIIMLGEHKVGKTQLINRYTKNEFNLHHSTTLGVEFTTQTVVIDGKRIGAQIWDTAGQERFKSLAEVYYKGAVGAILVYDISNQESFDRVCKKWQEDFKSSSDSHVVAILVGNKCDLKDERKVATEDAK
eukprot:TRINITY_DN3471_c0_g1_i1.p1 TRINITY_DN3471_c0_g1~~TRINITY_DN3471_c0_g1_i1.p1  ORF type:complete len:144 (-),score=32.13 TRINITY_DN3471_c0_g1_i1:333-764(-)